MDMPKALRYENDNNNNNTKTEDIHRNAPSPSSKKGTSMKVANE